jgi:protein-S-isoprenylcysteine O-methyltransferase Ste14
MLKNFVRIHKVNIAIFVFLVVFSTIHLMKPQLMYNDEGGFRPFGLGYRNKTVVPIWLVSIFLAIFCYLGVLYYLQNG